MTTNNNNEIEAGAVVINTKAPVNADEAKIQDSLRYSRNLLRRALKDSIAKLKEQQAAEKEQLRAAKAEAIEYAIVYGSSELAESGLVDNLRDAVNALLHEGHYDAEDFLGEVHVGRTRYMYADTSQLLDDDGLLVVRFECAAEVYPTPDARETEPRTLSYHVTVNERLHTLIAAMESVEEACEKLSQEIREAEKKLRLSDEKVEDIETALLGRKLEQTENGKELVQQLHRMLAAYVNGEEMPSLLAAYVNGEEMPSLLESHEESDDG